MSSSFRLFALLAAGLLVAPVIARADNNEKFASARDIAQKWLAEIDAGHYDQSYTDGGAALHDKVQPDQWIKILKTERPLLGKLVKRDEVDQTYRPDGLEGSSGEFIIFTYRSAFETKPDEMEYVVLKHEFGGWRCVGYDFGPGQTTPSDSDSGDGPTTTTTTQTLTPPTPTNGITVPAKRTH